MHDPAGRGWRARSRGRTDGRRASRRAATTPGRPDATRSRSRARPVARIADNHAEFAGCGRRGRRPPRRGCRPRLAARDGARPRRTAAVAGRFAGRAYFPQRRRCIHAPQTCVLRASPTRACSHLTYPPTSRPPRPALKTRRESWNSARRDLLKVGLFSSAALMLPAERVARTKLAVANRLPQSKLPEPFTLPWKTPPAAPKTTIGGVDYFTITQQQTKVNILPDRQTTIWGYNGVTPGPTIYVDQAPAGGRPPDLRAARRHPVLGYQRGPRPTSTARARCPSSTATPATRRRRASPSTTSTPTSRRPARSGTTTTASTTPPRTPTWAWRRSTTSRRRRAGAAHPAGRVRPAVHPQGRDVPGRRRPGLRRQRRERHLSATSSSSTACRGRRWRWSRARTASACSTPRSRAPTTSRSDTGQPMTVVATDGGLMPAPAAVRATSGRHGRALRARHRLLEVRAGQRVVLKNRPEEQRRLSVDRHHGVRGRGGDTPDPTNNEIPGTL